MLRVGHSHRLFSVRDVIKLFGWRPAEAEAAAEALVAAGKLRRGLELKEKELKDEWIAVKALAASGLR